jgi:D-alanyl-lipoteichoic acid acyltransferase DltB (MBOAT superfamily)
MPNLLLFLVLITVYTLAARGALSSASQKTRLPLFAVINILGFASISLLARYDEWLPDPIGSLGAPAVLRHLGLIATYIGLIAVGYFLTRALAEREGIAPWVAFFYPICLLIGYRYFSPLWYPFVKQLGWPGWVLTATIVGLSYMAFRLSYLVLELRNRVVAMPSLSEYLGFAFFLPTIVIGPISPFAYHQSSLNSLAETSVPASRGLLRILVGATKYFFLANLADQLTYNGIFLDGKPHGMLDLAVAAIFYYIYLFCNFSGFCDMVIGLSSLIGISVKENFNNPFAARNLKEFWNRWHITLSEYVRDVVFAPVSTFLIRKFGVKYINFGISIAITAVFLVIGVWDGLARHYILFGMTQAVGMIANHYYTIWMRSTLGPKRYKAYNENRYVNAAAYILTFLYVAFSLGFFANSHEMLGVIRHSLVSG